MQYNWQYAFMKLFIHDKWCLDMSVGQTKTQWAVKA